MTYAQKNTPNLNDTTGEGSLLVAFSNLLERFGKMVDPSTLGSDMKVRGIVEVMFGSLSIIDATIQVSSFGGPSVPTNNNTIMKFDYVSPITSLPSTHYCLVQDFKAGTIVDSYSGTVKNWSVYGGPGSWASYLVTEAVTPSVAAPEPVKSLADVVIANDNTVSPEASDEAVPGIAPIVETTGNPGNEEDAVTISVKVKKADPFSWQATFIPYLGVLDCTAIRNVVVVDEAGEQSEQNLVAGTLVPIAGTFKKDGVVYYRTVTSIGNNTWYGIPAGVLIRTDKLDEDEDINIIYEDTGDSTKDKVIKTAATIEGKTKRLFNLGKKK